MDAMVLTAALASAEGLINKTLAYDPATCIALGQLSPQILALSINSPECTIFIAPGPDGLRLLGQYEGMATSEIQGSIPALIALAGSKHINLKDSGVRIIGSTTFIADLQRILNQVDIDWEEMLCTLVGDIAGHQGAEFIRGTLLWTQKRTATMQRLLSEFLTEELRALPGKPELDWFYRQVDEMRLSVDRTQARSDQLRTRLDTLTAQQE